VAAPPESAAAWPSEARNSGVWTAQTRKNVAFVTFGRRAALPKGPTLTGIHFAPEV